VTAEKRPEPDQHCQGHRVVFRNDPEKEFQSTLPSLLLDGLKVLRLDDRETGALFRLARRGRFRGGYLGSSCREGRRVSFHAALRNTPGGVSR
jgi:hypothetical protein